MTASLSLRAALCTDADDEGPAQCANGAANYTPAVLSPATVVSLCHGKRPLGPPPSPQPTVVAAAPPALHGSVACALAAEGGVGSAVILDGRVDHAVLLSLLGENSMAGTSVKAAEK